MVADTTLTTRQSSANRLGISTTAFQPGLWGTALPFPSPLAFSLGYLMVVDEGVIAVDLGWNSDASWEAFVRGLSLAGAEPDDLVGVVVTHVHPDHYGLADRVRTNTGAWIAMHQAEVPHIVRDEHESTQRLERMSAWMVTCGVPGQVLAEIRSEEAELRSGFASVMPDVLLSDGDIVPSTDGSLIARHTPGHTPGHLCFHDRDRNVLFTGDHLLPRVTPNVSRRPGYGDDPLAAYLQSLDAIGEGFADPFVLPGHEWAFDTLSPRLQYLRDHHDERSQAVESVVAAGARTVWEVSSALPWARPFDQLASRGRRQAVGETHAHLYWLRNQGRLELTVGPPEEWSVPASV